ncbi:MAG: Trk family potassium uptake protein [Clostridia bacterium]|nr:Trk family potassium uptake protein [Clostridia bacterium]
MKKKLSSIRIIAFGYMLFVMVGALLLTMPFASRSGQSAGFLNALFTATSSSCVTGLIVLDTATSWSFFGQAVIICLIQVGGLGFMTIATMFSIAFKRRIGLRARMTMVESINNDNIGSILSLTKTIVKGTATIEGFGALILATRFVPEFGAAKGIWYSVFHSISAFCNAGFDLMGVYEPYCSLSKHADDVIVNITVMALITVGGLGFFVWDDIHKNRMNFKKYALHTKIVITVSAILTFGGALLFLIFERNHTNAGLGFGQSVLNSFFDSVTARTAGFNTTDTASLSSAGRILTVFLMFIGGSPGSTAGGMKTTTLAVIAISTFNGIRRRQSKGIFGRRLEDDAIHKASSVAFTNISLALAGIILICAFQPSMNVSDIIFEVTSALGTVGMTTGITRDLVAASRIVIIFLMYCGRVGSVSFALALMEPRTAPPVKNPKEKITIG